MHQSTTPPPDQQNGRHHSHPHHFHPNPRSHHHHPHPPPPPSSPSSSLHKLASLLSPSLLRSTLVLWLLFFASAFSYYGLVLLTTQLTTTQPTTRLTPPDNGSGGSAAAVNTSSLHCPASVHSRGLLAAPSSILPPFPLPVPVSNPFSVPTLHSYHHRRTLLPSSRRSLVISHLQDDSTTNSSSSASHSSSFSSSHSSVSSSSSLSISPLPGCAPDNQPEISSQTYSDVFITSAAELPGLLLALGGVEIFGRKTVLWVLLCLAGFLLLPLIHPLSPVATTIFLFAARAAIMGSFAVLWAYTPEIYPTEIRSTGLGVANSWARLGGFVCPFVAVGLIEGCRRELAILLFVFIPVFAALITACFATETKDTALGGNLSSYGCSDKPRITMWQDDGTSCLTTGGNTGHAASSCFHIFADSDSSCSDSD
ncbi:hypothetical protein CLOM_g4082 [Closterium sp. NIES-68]|nr:hypothetical protein CLOM_g4082 [Closterium sp. NIES-68]